jgi:hypothetical protein
MGQHTFGSAAEVKRYLKSQDVGEPVFVRGDRTGGSLWFTVTLREPRPRWYTSIAVERLPVEAELDAVRTQHFHPASSAVTVVCLQVLAPVDEPDHQARVAGWLRKLADCESLFLSSDADQTAERFCRLHLALQYTNAIVTG